MRLKDIVLWILLRNMSFVLFFTKECDGINTRLSSQYDNLGLPRECPPMTLRNGKIRMKQRGRMARFQCHWGYQMMGQRYVNCTPRGWDSPPPVCYRSGCPTPPPIANGININMHSQAVLMYFCHNGYQMVGNSVIYCDGSRWNDTQPKCVEDSKNKISLSCDFEDEDMCGWRHDPLHDFDWKRQKSSKQTSLVGTGPWYDHTKGVLKDGHYMYIESTSQVENDTARLISPLYPPSLTRSGCFVFYYYMYGRSTGTLRVIVHPSSIDLTAIVADASLRTKYTMFQKTGNQGSMWFKGFFDLDVISDDDFQIVIEAVRGPGFVSDIAVDDVAILQSEECVQDTKEETATTLPATKKDSCVNRCNQTGKVTTSGEVVECYCNDDCNVMSLCCVDYKDICVFELTEDKPISEMLQGLSTTEAEEIGASDSSSNFMSKASSLDPNERLEKTATYHNIAISSTAKFTTITTLPTPTLTTLTPTIKTTTLTPTTIRTTITSTLKTTTPIKQTPTTLKTITTSKTTKAPLTRVKLPPPKVITTPKSTSTQQNIKTTTAKATTQLFKTTLVRKLTYVTAPPPLKNATGILNKTIPVVKVVTKNSTLKPIVPNAAINSSKGSQTVTLNTNISITIPSTKMIPVYTTAIPLSKFSKTYLHYGRSEDGKIKTNDAEVIGTTNRNIINSKNTLRKNDRIMINSDDAFVNTPNNVSSTTGIVVGTTIVLLAIVVTLTILIRTGRIERLMQRGRHSLMRLDSSSSSSNADMRFLVQEEELEHDYENGDD